MEKSEEKEQKKEQKENSDKVYKNLIPFIFEPFLWT